MREVAAVEGDPAPGRPRDLTAVTAPLPNWTAGGPEHGLRVAALLFRPQADDHRFRHVGHFVSHCNKQGRF